MTHIEMGQVFITGGFDSRPRNAENNQIFLKGMLKPLYTQIHAPAIEDPDVVFKAACVAINNALEFTNRTKELPTFKTTDEFKSHISKMCRMPYYPILRESSISQHFTISLEMNAYAL